MKTGTLQRRRERIDRGIKVRTEGLYALMSWRELAYLIAPRLVLIAGLILLPLIVPGMYWQRVISIVCIYALLAISFDFLAHYVGLVSLGGAFFVGVGGYLAALLNTELGLSPPGLRTGRLHFRWRGLYLPAVALPALARSLLRHHHPHVSPLSGPHDRSAGYSGGD